MLLWNTGTCSILRTSTKLKCETKRATCHIRMSIVPKQVVLSGPELQRRQEHRLAEEAVRQRKKGQMRKGPG